MRKKLLKQYDALREMAMCKDHGPLAAARDWWRSNRVLLLFTLVALGAAANELLEYRAQAEESKARALKVSFALLRTECKSQPTSYFIVGADQKVVDGALMRVSSQIYEMREGRIAARETIVSAGYLPAGK